MEEARHSCLKLHLVGDSDSDTIFVKGTWFPSRFDLTITNGLQAWLCIASEEEVRERAAQWDQSVSDYIDFAERHLGFQHPDSLYSFAHDHSTSNSTSRRLSWTFLKEGTQLEWRWKCQLASDCKTTTAGILDFLMDANIRLSDEVVKKTQSYERLKVEADKCVAQSERFANDRTEFESAIYAKNEVERLRVINIRQLVPTYTFTADKRWNSRMKSVKIEFLAVLNSKKAKLRDLRDQFSKQKTTGKLTKQQDEESTDRTESFDDESDEDESGEKPASNVTSTSKDTPTQGQGRGRGRGRGKRIAHK